MVNLKIRLSRSLLVKVDKASLNFPTNAQIFNDVQAQVKLLSLKDLVNFEVRVSFT